MAVGESGGSVLDHYLFLCKEGDAIGKTPKKTLTEKRLSLEETEHKLREIQTHFINRISSVVDDEIEDLVVEEICDDRSSPQRCSCAPIQEEVDRFTTAVAKSFRQYCGQLWDAELRTCGEAASRLKTVPLPERAAVIEEQLRQWREQSAKAVCHCAPKLFHIGRRFAEYLGKPPSDWTKAKLVEGINSRLRPANFFAVRFWCMAACDEKGDEAPGQENSWRMPTWMAVESIRTSAPAASSSLDAKVELGRWAVARLQEARKFADLVRAGCKPDTLREQFPQLFADVIDQLRPESRATLIKDASWRRMRIEELMMYIADVKALSGTYLKKIATKSRKGAL